MRRREFITFLSGMGACWPLTLWAQQAAMPLVGFLRSTPTVEFEHLLPAFRRGLEAEGFVAGRNVEIVQRWADNNGLYEP